MKKKSMKSVAMVLILLLAWMTVSPAVAVAGDYEDGKTAGKNSAVNHYDSKAKTGWFFAGFGFGIIGTGVAYLKKPTQVAERYVGNDVSTEYKKGFIDGFCEFANKERGKYALGGWGTWIVVFLAAGGASSGN